MSDIFDKIKRWFGRQERRSVQADRRHQQFDDMTDRVADHKDHMTDRIQRPDE